MTSSVPNLGHVIQILVRSFTFIPTFMVHLLLEVGFLNETCDLIVKKRGRRRQTDTDERQNQTLFSPEGVEIEKTLVAVFLICLT